MRKLSIIIFGIILTGCITLHTPQSRNEYVSAVAKGEGFTKIHNYTVVRKFSSVVKNINRKSKSCLSKKNYSNLDERLFLSCKQFYI